ncbi:hypothetical protein Z042_20065 [Chania multitudinisentens RB-25]|uniref:Uncharacterized protein n=1 Tax=Chania multitudinisentens RB-25 TaxID=1441930 RepID=W0LGS8_9GAMM|nr:hypothetical protein Z042_20065 [Chania multitudinisentens RB-25]
MLQKIILKKIACLSIEKGDLTRIMESFTLGKNYHHKAMVSRFIIDNGNVFIRLVGRGNTANQSGYGC